MVSGPTPPGTGVRAPATAATSGCTSPTTVAPRRSSTSRRGESGPNSAATRSRSVIREVPTSITVAPRFTKSAVTKPGRPMAATRMSAADATAGRSRVREWHTVTVACRCSNRAASGLPTMSLRPMTTARRPSMGMPFRSSSSMMPEGVPGTRAGRFCTSRPTLTGWKPSTSLAGSMASKTCCSASAPIPSGSGDCTRTASTASAALNRATIAMTSSRLASAGRRSRSARMPSASQARTLFRT